MEGSTPTAGQQVPATEQPLLDGYTPGPDGEGALARADEVTGPAVLATDTHPGLPPELPPLPKTRRLPRFDIASRRIELVSLLLALLVSFAFVPQVIHFSHRNDAERVIVNRLPFWQTFEHWELSLYDSRFVSRGPIAPQSLDKLAIVGIDDKSMSALGQWPFPRDWHAQLIKKLKAAGARAIVLDFDFSSKQNPQTDKALEDAMAAANQTVILPSTIATDLNQSGSAQADKHGSQYVTTTPLEDLDAQTADVAFAHVPKDTDDAVRRYTYHGVLSAANVGSLATLASATYQGLLDHNENKKYEQFLVDGRWPALDGVVREVPLLLAKPPESDLAPHVWYMLLQYWGPPGTFKTYSYSDVLKGETGDYSTAGLKKNFDGRIVLVGATAHLLKDVFPAPRFNQTGVVLQQFEIPGVELHAAATAQLLDGFYLREESTQTVLASLFLFTFFCAVWTVAVSSPINRFARSTQQKWTDRWVQKHPGRPTPFKVNTIVWIVSYLVMAAIPFVASSVLAQWLFNHYHLWVVVVYPWVSALITCGIVLVMLFSLETAELAKTTTQFGRYVAPEVMEEILAHPEEDYPRPRKAYVTVLFTDLEGFTTYSENHRPEDVVEALNEYMDRMMPIVRAHGGTFDKYIGDAIMAYFGAPVPRWDHAAQALHCAVAMQEECARFREETGIEFYMRVGVHTGDCIVGSMGSADCLNYTAIGDTVNLASRLEGKNKDFGSWIMCSQATYEAAPDAVEVESASTKIKGKSQSVDVYIVRGLKGLPECDKHWGRQLQAGQAGELPQSRPQDEAEKEGLPALPSGTL